MDGADEEVFYRRSSENDFRISRTLGNRKRLELDLRSAFEFETPAFCEIRDRRMNEGFFLVETDLRYDGALGSRYRNEFRVLRQVEYPFFRNRRPFFGIEKGLGDFDAFLRIGDFHLSEFFKTVFQRNSADVLDFKSGAGVDFEEFRTIGGYDPVEREVPEIGEELDFGRMEKDRVPMRNLSFLIRGVAFGKPRGIVSSVNETARDFSVSDVESEAYAALCEVGFAIRSVGGHAHHRGYGNEIENDDADIREPMFAECRERIRRYERFFNQYRVGSRSYRVFPLEHVRKATLEFVAFVFGPRGSEFRGFAGKFPHDHDAASLASAVGFGDEFFRERVEIEMPEFVLVSNASVGFRNRYSSLR